MQRNSFVIHFLSFPESECIGTSIKTYWLQSIVALWPLFLVYPIHELHLLRFAIVLKSLCDEFPRQTPQERIVVRIAIYHRSNLFLRISLLNHAELAGYMATYLEMFLTVNTQGFVAVHRMPILYLLWIIISEASSRSIERTVRYRSICRQSFFFNDYPIILSKHLSFHHRMLNISDTLTEFEKKSKKILIC